MHYSELIKIGINSDKNSSPDVPKAKTTISSISESDLLVDFVDVDEEYSDLNKSETDKKKTRSKKSRSDKTADYNTFQMKMYGDEKSRLEYLADAAGTDMSAFAKMRIFSDENIIILDKSRFISRSLIEINDHLTAIAREGKMSDELLKQNYSKLCEIASAFISISKELTLFKTSTQKEETL